MDSSPYVPTESGFIKKMYRYIDTSKIRIHRKFILENKSFAIYSKKNKPNKTKNKQPLPPQTMKIIIRIQIPGGGNAAGSSGQGCFALE